MAALVIALLPGPASAQLFQQVDHPSAVGLSDQTTLWAASDGRVVGYYYISASNTQSFFIYDIKAQTFTPLNHPLEDGRLVTAVGLEGDAVVGHYQSGDPTMPSFRGYIYDGALFTTFDFPVPDGTPVSTYPQGIDGGTIVGFYEDGSHSLGFVRTPAGEFSSIEIQGAAYTSVTDISGGRVIGDYAPPPTPGGPMESYGFFIEDGVYHTGLSYPGSLITVFIGIDGDTILGRYVDSRGELGSFLFDIPTRSWSRFELPHVSEQTIVTDIDAGTIVGYSWDSDREMFRGFVATIPEPSTAMMTAFAVLFGAMRRTRAAQRR